MICFATNAPSSHHPHPPSPLPQAFLAPVFLHHGDHLIRHNPLTLANTQRARRRPVRRTSSSLRRMKAGLPGRRWPSASVPLSPPLP